MLGCASDGRCKSSLGPLRPIPGVCNEVQDVNRERILLDAVDDYINERRDEALEYGIDVDTVRFRDKGNLMQGLTIGTGRGADAEVSPG